MNKILLIIIILVILTPVVTPPTPQPEWRQNDFVPQLLKWKWYLWDNYGMTINPI